MDPLYALKRLLTHATAARTAQKAYYACKGDPRTDKLKQEHLSDCKGKEADLDTLLVSLTKLFPLIIEKTDEHTIPAGALSIAEINRSRLSAWIDTLTIHDAVPQVVIAIGMGESIGKLIVLCKEDQPPQSTISFLRGAICQVESR